MKKILLLIIGILCTLFINAQAPDVNWQKLMGGTDDDQASDIQQTSDGGYIIAGSSDSQDGDVGSTNGDYDYWILKLNGEGDLVWKNNFGGSDWDIPTAIKSTSDGGYIVVGHTHSDDGDVTDMNGFRDAWVVKINSIGELQWQNALGGTGADSAEGVIENNDGYLVLGFAGAFNDGDLQNTSCDSDFWVAQLNFNGELMWQECYGGSGIDKPEEIISAGGNYLIVGSTSSNDGDVTNNHGYYDMWVVQIDDSGNLIGQKTLGGSELDEGMDAYYNASGSDGEFVIIGTTYSNDGDVASNHGGLDYWMVTLDATLNVTNEKTFGGSLDEEAYSVLSTNDGKLIITGDTQSSDGDVMGFNGGADAWAIKVDLTGNLIWSKCVGGSAGDVSYASVNSTNDNGFLLTGWTKSSEFTGYQGSGDLWIVKLGGMPSAIGAIPFASDALKIFPNPGTRTNTIYIEHDLTKAERLIVRNISGQTIIEKAIDESSQNIPISISNCLPGTYVIVVYSPLGVQVGKLIVLE